MFRGESVRCKLLQLNVTQNVAAVEESMRTLREWMKNNLLLVLTFSGVVFGIILGLSLRSAQLSQNAVLLLAYPGELFMRLLKLMILPMVIASLISGSASLNAKMNGKIAIRTIVYFLLTSLLNSILGMGLVLALHPGDPNTKDVLGSGNEDREVNILDGFLDLGRNMFPDNLFQASIEQAHTVYKEKISVSSNLTENGTADVGPKYHTNHHITTYVRSLEYRSGTNTLGIIFFCLVFGTALGMLGKRGKLVTQFFCIIDEVILKIVTGIMWVSPIGVCSVILGKILDVDNLALVMQQLAMFIVTVVIGVVIYQLIISQLIYFVFTRKNPFRFYWGLVEAWVTAFATASTAATLPVSYRCMDQKNKVDPRISRFVMPIGATVNMDGTALFVTIASVFIAQMNEIPLGVGEIITVCLTSTAASIAAASVPSAALVLMLIVLTAIEAPVQDVSLLFAVDWFVDRVRTTNNMLGDCYAAAVVEQLSKKELCRLDEEAGADNNSYFKSDLEAGQSKKSMEFDVEVHSDSGYKSSLVQENGDLPHASSSLSSQVQASKL